MAFLTALMARFAVLPALLGGIPSLLAGIVKFLSTPLGQIMAAVAIAGGMFVWGDIHRGRADATWHRAEVQRLAEDAQHRQQQRDGEIKTSVERDVGVRLASMEKFNTELQGKVESYEKELAKRSGDVCRLDSGDISRLRKL